MATETIDQNLTETEAPETQTQSKPQSRKGSFWVAVLSSMTAVAASAGILSYESGRASRDKDVAEALNRGNRDKNVLMSLANVGFANIVGIQTSDEGVSKVTLSIDPTNPNACKRALYASEDATRVSLSQYDADGREYSRVSASNGAEAREAIVELCGQRP